MLFEARVDGDARVVACVGRVARWWWRALALAIARVGRGLGWRMRALAMSGDVAGRQMWRLA